MARNPLKMKLQNDIVSLNQRADVNPELKQYLDYPHWLYDDAIEHDRPAHDAEKIAAQKIQHRPDTEYKLSTDELLDPPTVSAHWDKLGLLDKEIADTLDTSISGIRRLGEIG